MSPMGHWADCMKRRAAPRLPLATACAASTLTQLAVLSWRLKRDIAYDIERGEVVDNPYANRLLGG
jgi:hypothetical protein